MKPIDWNEVRRVVDCLAGRKPMSWLSRPAQVSQLPVVQVPLPAAPLDELRSFKWD